ncbi:MAG: hypothetical protein CMJ33_05585 [Phycisphaerae bacterium]|nr:hypothetical protein [Phycisphaerae bacterium]
MAHETETSQASTPDSLDDATSRIHHEVSELILQRRRHRRARLRKFILLGCAISIPFHLLLIFYLAFIRIPGPPGLPEVESVIDFAVLAESELQEMEVELEIEELAAEETELDDALSEMLAEEAEDLSVASVTEFDDSGSVPTPGSSSGFSDSDSAGTGLSGSASFFGVGGRGRRFAFIIDMSGSMKEDDRFKRAVRQLRQSISDLPDFITICLSLFSSGADSPLQPPFQRDWLPMNRRNKQQIIRWIEDVSPENGTEPLPAFRQIFKLENRPDVVYFLTDGAIPQDTPDRVSELNAKGRPVIINTFAFGDQADVAPLLRIARESGGKCKQIGLPGGGP